MNIEAMIANLKADKAEKDAEDAGYDAAVNGANETNCDFRWFSSPHLTRAWERGRDRAKGAK